MRTTLSIKRIWWPTLALAAVVAALAIGLPAMLAQGADHREAPGVLGDPSADIGDVYAFVSPTDSDRVVFIMTVNPFAGALSPETFDPETRYDFKIDTDGDAKEDMTFTAMFSSSTPNLNGDHQMVTLKRGPAVINEMVALDGVPSTSFDPGDPRADAGVFTIEATFANTTSEMLTEVFFRVSEIADHATLLGGDAGETTRLSDPLAPGESFTQIFEIGLSERARFEFFVDAFGVASTNGDTTLASGFTGEDIDVIGGGHLRADLFDDPFFFDLAAFGGGTLCDVDGVDFFAGANVSAIVLEIPSDMLGATDIGLWARTSGFGPRIDRMGRPVINTVLIPSTLKDAFNAGFPQNDLRDFRDAMIDTLIALGNDEATANGLADFLLPDILTTDTSSSAGFPNGRGLEDDVIDVELGLLGVPPFGDCVDANDVPFLTGFPYLADPHENDE